MDSLTQAVLGAAIGESMLGKKIGKKGAIIGGLIATIPDLDILLFPFFDPLEKISIHRGYSHSILFCVIVSLLLAFMLNRIKWTEKLSFRRLGLFSFMTLITHALLDAFTSYGTQLFLPFNDWRVSFDSISIIDPVYTIPLLIGVLTSNIKYKNDDNKRSFPNNIGLIISTLYLLFTLSNKQHIQNIFYTELEKKNILSFRLLTVPVAIGSTAWYGVAKDKTHLHIGKYSLLKDYEIEFHSFAINDHLLNGLDSELVNKLKWFAQGYYTVAEKDGKIRVYNMQCDMQGIREFGGYKAPTAFYYEITPNSDGSYDLSAGMHPSQ